MDEGWRDVRRNAKDSVFVKFFEDRANVFRLYRELHPEDSDSSEEDVRVRTLRRVIAKGYANDLGFSVGGRIICLVEAQSYSMEAIRLRTLFYLATTFQEYLSENRMTVYDARKGALPRWEAYVVHVGGGHASVTRMGGISEDLSDGSLDTEVPVGDGGLLKGYIDVCGIIDSVAAEGSGRDSVLRAFEACRGCGAMGEFVWSRRHEIMGVYEQLFDEEENLRMNCEAYEKKGRLEGLAEGLSEGRRLQNVEVARRLVSMGMSAEDVSEATGMTLEEVLRLRRGRHRRSSALFAHLFFFYITA
jgi:hypothetical protein